MRLRLPQFSLPLQCVGIFLLAFLWGSSLPSIVASFFLTLSLTLKELLLFVLPLIIFTFVFNSMTQMRDRALPFLLILVPMVCLSNFLSTNLSYFLARLINTVHMHSMSITPYGEPLLPLWQIKLPPFFSNEGALGVGLVVGVVVSFLKPALAERAASFFMRLTSFVLKDLFLPLMPLFILGFVLKLAHDQVLGIICHQYFKLFLILFGLLTGYLAFIYGLAVRFRPSLWKAAFQNMAPAAITGFSTMSSAASLPLMILGAEKNVDHPDVARGVVPATVNIHLMGDCFAIPLFALTLLMSFGQGFPDYETYLVFALYFVLAKFAVAAVPGGGILVMLPILEKYLGFSPEMLSIITVLYITFDPIITSANVLGNGAFAMIFSRLFARWGLKKGVTKIPANP